MMKTMTGVCPSKWRQSEKRSVRGKTEADWDGAGCGVLENSAWGRLLSFVALMA